jgi:hypothetical protein
MTIRKPQALSWIGAEDSLQRERMNNLPQRMVDKCMPIPESGCLIWMGQCEHGGYGMVWFEGKKRLAHRVSYLLHKGTIPEGQTLDHLCRVPACINPDHLEPVTRRENTLRGDGPAGINSRKTHCINGHKFTEENIYMHPRGFRQCRICRKRET